MAICTPLCHMYQPLAVHPFEGISSRPQRRHPFIKYYKLTPREIFCSPWEGISHPHRGQPPRQHGMPRRSVCGLPLPMLHLLREPEILIPQPKLVKNRSPRARKPSASRSTTCARSWRAACCVAGYPRGSWPSDPGRSRSWSARQLANEGPRSFGSIH